MPEFQLPFDFNAAFELLNDIPQEKLEYIIYNSGKISGRISSYDFLNEASNELETNKEDLKQVFNLFLNLIAVIEAGDIETDTLLDDISKTLRGREISFDETLFEKLRFVLTNKDTLFYLKCKASLLSSENESLFQTSKIFTDYRPIFGGSFESELQGGMIFHKLKLDYFENGHVNTKYFTLDLADLSKLKNELIRAEKKEKALRNCFSKDNKKIFEI